MILIIDNEVKIQGNVDECIEFLKKYNEEFAEKHKEGSLLDQAIPLTEESKNKMFYVDYKNPTTVWDILNNTNSCEGCLYFEELKRNPNPKPTVGDTPCTWCPKRQATCKTCSQPGIGDVYCTDTKLNAINIDSN